MYLKENKTYIGHNRQLKNKDKMVIEYYAKTSSKTLNFIMELENLIVYLKKYLKEWLKI